MNDDAINEAFAQHTLDVEARRDPDTGNLIVYSLPKGDGGGVPVRGHPYGFEVAGINNKWHPKMSNRLRALIDAGQPERAEAEAREYLHNYTNAVDEWHPDEIIEGYLRACAFNRGAGGAAWIAQYATKYAYYPSLYKARLDGDFGEKTKEALDKADPDVLLTALYGARIIYERTPVERFRKGRRTETSGLWHGLFRRFNNDLVFALSLKGD